MVKINKELQKELRKEGYSGGFELEELIAAFGEDVNERIDALVHTHDNHGWYAQHGVMYGLVSGRRSTPSEAVAELWLMVKYKKDGKYDKKPLSPAKFMMY